MTSCLRPPTFIPITPSSNPLMTAGGVKPAVKMKAFDGFETLT